MSKEQHHSRSLSGHPTGARSTLHLLSLPQELQDVIFSYAYARPTSNKLISQQAWHSHEMREKHESSSYYAIRPFPGPKVSAFLVSKQFFVAAARAYITSRQFNDGLHFCINDLVESRGIVTEYAEDCVVWSGELISGLRNLKRLTLQLDEQDFARATTGTIFDHQLSKTELTALPVCCILDEVRGLDQVNIEMSDPPSMCSQSELDMWKLNVRALEDIIRSRIMRPRSDATTRRNRNDGHVVPLYAGSAVCFGTSELRKPFRSEALLRFSTSSSAINNLRDGLTDTIDDFEKASEDLQASLPWLSVSTAKDHPPKDGAPDVLEILQRALEDELLHKSPATKHDVDENPQDDDISQALGAMKKALGIETPKQCWHSVCTPSGASPHDRIHDTLRASRKASGVDTVNTTLRDEDIPVTLEAVHALLLEDGDAVMGWISMKKDIVAEKKVVEEKEREAKIHTLVTIMCKVLSRLGMALLILPVCFLVMILRDANSCLHLERSC